MNVLARLVLLATGIVIPLHVTTAGDATAPLSPSQSNSCAFVSSEVDFVLHGTPRMLLGVYINGAPQSGSDIARYVRLAGRPPTLMTWYRRWIADGEPQGFPWRALRKACAAGAVPEITWQPWAGKNPDRRFTLTRIIDGTFDTYIKRWATAAKKWGYPFFLRFAHEMNTGWYPWGTAAGNAEGNTPKQFVAAWRHVYNIFKAVGADNVIWVWCPNRDQNGFTPLARDYPGNAYVDWVGIDAYNAPWAHWTPLRDLIGPAYREMSSLHKPMMIGEIASGESGGNKAAWIRQGFLADLPRFFPQIRAVTWFDAKKEADWRIDSSLRSLRAWRDVVSFWLYRLPQPYVSGTALTLSRRLQSHFR